MKLLRPSAPQRVGDLLTRAVPALVERMLEETIRKEWALVAGLEVARRSQPGALDRGVLEVRADNSPWLMEMTMRTGEILGSLRARYGPRITALRCTLGPVPRVRVPTGRTRPSAPAALRLGKEEAQEVETLVASVPDPKVAAALRRLLTKDRLARRQRAEAPTAEGSSS